jgi:hypothetical protein
VRGGHCGGDRTGGVGGLSYGMQQHQVLTALCLVRIADYHGSAITIGEFREGSR